MTVPVAFAGALSACFAPSAQSGSRVSGAASKADDVPAEEGADASAPHAHFMQRFFFRPVLGIEDGFDPATPGSGREVRTFVPLRYQDFQVSTRWRWQGGDVLLEIVAMNLSSVDGTWSGILTNSVAAGENATLERELWPKSALKAGKQAQVTKQVHPNDFAKLLARDAVFLQLEFRLPWNGDNAHDPTCSDSDR